MQEISFSIPVSGVIRIEEGIITVTVNRAETAISFEREEEKPAAPVPEKGKTIYDVVLETAQNLVEGDPKKRFTAADLYHEVIKTYPGFKRNSWAAHVMASAPDHPSYKHYPAKRDYFDYLGNATYRLNSKYLKKEGR